MFIKQAPKYLLSFILCTPALVSADATPQQSTQPSPAKVQTVAQKAPVAYPKRGMSMTQVRKHYGEPRSIRKSKGRIKKRWPRITVWNYGNYSVYFERTRVLHTVVH